MKFSASNSRRQPWLLRLVLVFVGAVLIGLLVTARTLEPSPQGYGTHTQLGLNPCSIQEFAGFRCPSCGMTTSWAYTTRGNLLGGIKANVGGTLLALMAAIVGPWLFMSGLLGTWWWRRPNEWAIVAVSSAIVLITIFEWGLRVSGLM